MKTAEPTKTIERKLRSENGESIAEVLITALVVALGALLLVAMVVASRNIIQKSERAYNTYLNGRNTEETLEEGHNENRPADSETTFSVEKEDKSLTLEISVDTTKDNAVRLDSSLKFKGTTQSEKESADQSTADSNSVVFHVVKENGKTVFVSYDP